MAMTAEKQAAYRERQKLAGLDAERPWGGQVGEEREQAIRDFYGHSSSEKEHAGGASGKH